MRLCGTESGESGRLLIFEVDAPNRLHRSTCIASFRFSPLGQAPGIGSEYQTRLQRHAIDNCSILFCYIVSYKDLFSLSLTKWPNKLECLSLTNLYSLVVNQLGALLSGTPLTCSRLVQAQPYSQVLKNDREVNLSIIIFHAMDKHASLFVQPSMSIQ